MLQLDGDPMSLEDFIETLEAAPDEAFIQDDGKVAYVFDSERNAILHLEGNFLGHHNKVAWELRNAMAKQHPGVHDDQ
jgi:hypothetical protein